MLPVCSTASSATGVFLQIIPKLSAYKRRRYGGRKRWHSVAQRWLSQYIDLQVEHYSGRRIHGAAAGDCGGLAVSNTMGVSRLWPPSAFIRGTRQSRKPEDGRCKGTSQQPLKILAITRWSARRTSRTTSTWITSELADEQKLHWNSVFKNRGS